MGGWTGRLVGVVIVGIAMSWGNSALKSWSKRTEDEKLSAEVAEIHANLAKGRAARATATATESRPVPLPSDVASYERAMYRERNAWASLWRDVQSGMLRAGDALGRARVSNADHYGHTRVPFEIDAAILVNPDSARNMIMCRVAAIMVKYALASISNTGKPDEPVSKIEASLAKCSAPKA